MYSTWMYSNVLDYIKIMYTNIPLPIYVTDYTKVLVTQTDILRQTALCQYTDICHELGSEIASNNSPNSE